MTREEALKKLRRVFGARAYWQVGEKISRAEERGGALEGLQRARMARSDASAAMTARGAALCRADAQYQEHKRVYDSAKVEEGALQSTASYYRFQIGTLDPLPGLGNVFHVKGHGDTWEEAFADAHKKSAGRATRADAPKEGVTAK